MGNILYVWADPRARIDRSVFTGSSSHVFNLLKALRESGHQVTSVLPGEGTHERKAKASFGYVKNMTPSVVSTWLRDAYEIYHDVHFAKTYKNLFQDRKYDFIYERLSYFHQSCSKLAESINLPYIIEIHSTIQARNMFENTAHFSLLAKRIQDNVMKKANAIIVVSESLRKIYIQQGIPSNKIKVVPNGVDERHFDPAKVNGERIRRKYGLEGKTVIGLVSSMNKCHGIDLLIEAMEKVVQEFSNVRLLLVGPYENYGHSKKISKNQKGFLITTGAIPYIEISQYIAAMDICVLSSIAISGSPIKIFEYGAMGKPLIAPDYPAIRELLLQNEPAILYRPDNIESLAESILQLIQNHELALKFGEQLRIHILKEHTWRRNAERILDIFEEINGKRRNSNDGF